MDKSLFVNDQREVVLRAIRKLVPQLQISYTPPEITYTNPLLLNLNNNVRPIEENINRTVRFWHIYFVQTTKYANIFSSISLFRVNPVLALKFLIPKRVLLMQISRASSMNK